ncbi:hypothetical protein FLJC2902T_26890 [Flavobacterium limnosediminis JC2902]|uniref:Uncharacterized protein n=1 Tax=Flavobacterium limnosediminis JC2902 TaxID=1341181 RepID=V6SIE9_9FLAO|nr:hypothetical protein FLJC2902T_26890 [Flavobacterium limnosediminis JC2902]
MNFITMKKITHSKGQYHKPIHIQTLFQKQNRSSGLTS